MSEQNKHPEVRLELLQLQKRRLPELIAKWKLLFGCEPPQYGEVFMRRRLAHRIQELAYGGLDAQTQARLGSVNTRVKRAHSGLRLGTAIVRTWRDTRYEVRVCKEGFEWSGQVYGSLSAVARAITGVNRNGYEFFGIREKARHE